VASSLARLTDDRLVPLHCVGCDLGGRSHPDRGDAGRWMAKRFAAEAIIPARYWRLSTLWFVFGAVATLLPLACLYFMAFKTD
jgi:hypothetical protein